jgi:hypothetical protein
MFARRWCCRSFVYDVCWTRKGPLIRLDVVFPLYRLMFVALQQETEQSFQAYEAIQILRA